MSDELGFHDDPFVRVDADPLHGLLVADGEAWRAAVLPPLERIERRISRLPPRGSTPSTSSPSPMRAGEDGRPRAAVAGMAAGGREPRPRRRGVLISAISALLVVALLAGAFYLAGSRRPDAVPTAPQLILRLGDAGLGCPARALWSPDGAHLAILAYTEPSNGDPCYQGDGTARAAVYAIFDAHTGSLLHVVDPAAALALLGAHGYAGAYGAWAPDGRALVFPVSGLPPTSDGAEAIGLLWVPIDGDAPRMQTASLQGPSCQSFIWDVQVGRVVDVLPCALPPALSYRWGADGHLVQDRPLPASGAPSAVARPGSPPDAQSFILWGPGWLEPIYPLDGSGIPNATGGPIAFDYLSRTSAWSPDGRYLALEVSMDALLLPPSGPAPALGDPYCRFYTGRNACHTAAVAAPDAGFAAALAAAHRDGFAELAWRPDGKVLAGVFGGEQPKVRAGAAAPARITLLDAATGVQLRSLTAEPGAGSRALTGGVGVSGEPRLAWSPDGTRLAFFANGLGAVYVWGGASVRE